jgi:hypothetical protein
LVVIDQIYNEALRYSAEGESLGTVADAVETSLERFFPITVKTRGSDILFELGGHRLKTLDRNYAPVSDATFTETQPDRSLPATTVAPPQIRSLWMWQPVGTGDVVSFSDLKVPPSRLAPAGWACAFLRFPMAEPWRFRVLGRMLPYESSLRLYNRIGHEYVAALDDTAFILRMDELKIYRQVGDALEPLPIDLAEVTQPGVTEPPSLPRFWKQEDYTDVMAKVETSTMPTGLYAWDRYLFVTTRTFDGSDTRWSITKIDPNSNRVMGTATIKTTANHLTIAPGPDQWAFIEKGPIKGWNDNQEIPSILFVPAERFAHDLKADICGD